jgi:hypothetical protein
MGCCFHCEAWPTQEPFANRRWIHFVRDARSYLGIVQHVCHAVVGIRLNLIESLLRHTPHHLPAAYLLQTRASRVLEEDIYEWSDQVVDTLHVPAEICTTQVATSCVSAAELETDR